MKKLFFIAIFVSMAICSKAQSQITHFFLVMDQAGSLESIINNRSLQDIDSLTIYGSLNSSDIRTLRQMLGGKYRLTTDSSTGEGNLQYLDLSDAKIQEGGEDYLFLDFMSNPDLMYLYTSEDTIGSYMFTECQNMECIKIPYGINSIENMAFQNNKALKEIVIPEGVKTIKGAAFRLCSNLEHISLPSTLNNIGANLVTECTSLQTVACAANEPPICLKESFDDMTGVTLYVPQGCAEKYRQSVGWCNFTTIVETDPMDIHVEEAGGLETIINTLGFHAVENMKVAGYLNGSDIRILRQLLGGKYHKSVEQTKGNLHHLDLSEATIVEGGEGYLFYEVMSNPDLQLIYTSNDNIGFRMFWSCPNLQSIKLPQSVKIVDNDAFLNCQSLVSVIIPEGVTEMRSLVFRSCKALEQLKLPSTLTCIGDGLVKDCTSLKSVLCAAVAPPICTDATFDDMTDIKLYVPWGCAEKYRQSVGWRNFTIIVETDLSAIPDIIINPESTSKMYDLQGRKLCKTPTKGVYIQDGKKWVVR